MSRVTVVRVERVYTGAGEVPTFRVWFSEEVYDKLLKVEKQYQYIEADDELDAYRQGEAWLNRK